MTLLGRGHQQHHGTKAEGAGGAGGGGGGMMARARGLVRRRQVEETARNNPSPVAERPPGGTSGAAAGAEVTGLSSQSRPAASSSSRQQSSRERARRHPAATGTGTATAMSGRQQQTAPRSGSATRMRQVQGQQQMRGARSSARRAAGVRAPPPEHLQRPRTRSSRPAAGSAAVGFTGDSTSRTASTPPRNRPQHPQQRPRRDGPSAVGRSSRPPPTRSSRPDPKAERVLSARTNARKRSNINIGPSQKRLTAQHKEVSESFRRKRREQSRRKLGWEPGTASIKKVALTSATATATPTAAPTAAPSAADPPVNRSSLAGVSMLGDTARSSSSNSKLSGNSPVSAVSDASKLMQGRLSKVSQQSLRTAHNMPMANASLHNVKEDATGSALPGPSQRKLGEQALSVTSLFNWSNTSFEEQTKGLAEESEKKEEYEATDSLAALPPPASPKKRSSVHTVTTEGSHATAVVDNLTSSTSNLFQADEDRHLASKEQEGASILPATTSDATELATNAQKDVGVDRERPPSQPTTSPSADRGSRQVTTNNDYLNFVATASTKKLIVDDSPERVTTSRRSSLSGSRGLSVSDESTEFLRFRSEAAEFGKRNLIADAVAGLEDADREDGVGVIEDNKMQDPHADDGAPTGPGNIQAAPSADAAPRPQGQLRTLPPPPASQQRVRQRPVRETDTACTIADANDSFFPQESAQGALDEHIGKTRPPRMVGVANTSKSSVSSLSKPAPPHKKMGKMGRLLRNKKKKKDKEKLHRGVSARTPSREMPPKASVAGRKSSLATIFSERFVHGLHDSLTSVGSSVRNIGGGQRRSLNEYTAYVDPDSHISEINSVFPGAPIAATAAPIEPDPVPEPVKVEVDLAGGRDGLAREGSARSAEIQKGEKMLMKWRELGIDIATKQLHAGQAYYETGDLERARRCFAQVASLDHPLEGDDDATVVFVGLVTEAKSMLVKIDSVQSIGQLEDDAQPQSVVKSAISDATNDVKGTATGHVPKVAASAADTPTIAKIPEKGGARDESSDSQSSGSDIFVSVRNAFFEPEAEGDATTPAATMAAQSEPQPQSQPQSRPGDVSVDSDGFPRAQPRGSATEGITMKLDDFLHEAPEQDQDVDARSAYTSKDIEDMASDLASRHSNGLRSKHSSFTSIDSQDLDLSDDAHNHRHDDGDDDDNQEGKGGVPAGNSTGIMSLPEESSAPSSIGASDEVVIRGRTNHIDSLLPDALAMLQQDGTAYTVPMAPPSNRGLLASDSTLTSNVSPHHLGSTSESSPSSNSNKEEEGVEQLQELMTAFGEARDFARSSSLVREESYRSRQSEQSAGSDTAEVSTNKHSTSSRSDDSSYALPRGYDEVGVGTDDETVEEPPIDPDAECSPVMIVRKEQAMAMAKIQDPPTPSGEETSSDPPEATAADAQAREGKEDVDVGADPAEPIIYLRQNSSTTIVSDMIESTASSWFKQQGYNSSRENSSSSKANGENPSLTIVGEELVIEDGLDPAEQLRRAAAQAAQLEKEVDEAEKQAEERSKARKMRRNAKDSKRLYDQGLVYYADGDFEAARSCFASALKMRFQSLGQANLDVCLTQEKLGDTLVRLDKIEEAHWQYLMAYRGLQQCNLSQDNPHSSRILVSLGDVFFSAKDFSRALKYYEKGMRFRTEMNTTEAQDIALKRARAHEEMAKAEWSRVELDMCRFHVREMLWVMTYESLAAKAGYETKASSKTPSTSSTRLLVDTGVQLVPVSSSDEGDEDSSFSYIEESRALLLRKGSTCTDFDVVRVLDSTAHIHAERNEFVNAYKCYMEKLTFLRSKFPNKRKGMAEAAYQVGSMCSKMGRHTEAISYFSEALNLHQRSKSKDDDKISLLLKSLGSSYLSVKNPILALVHFKEHQSLCGMGGEKELLSIMGISRGKQYDLPRSLDCYAKVMDMEASEDQWLAQHNPLGALIETLEQIFSSPTSAQSGTSVNENARDCKDLKTILINLGLAQLIRSPKAAQPSEYVKNLVHYLNEDGCIDGVDFTQVLFSMGNILLRRKRYREAIIYYEKCIASFTPEERDAPTSNYVDLLTNLGTAYLRSGDHDMSFKHFRSALKEVKRARRRGSGDTSSNDLDGLGHFCTLLQEARDKASGRENNEDVLNLRHIIALYLCLDCRIDEAVEVLRDVERRMIKMVGEDHPDIIQLRVDISFALLLGGDAHAARDAYETAIGHATSGRIPEYHPFYRQYNRLVPIHYPAPVTVVSQPVLNEIPRRKDFVPRVA